MKPPQTFGPGDHHLSQRSGQRLRCAGHNKAQSWHDASSCLCLVSEEHTLQAGVFLNQLLETASLSTPKILCSCPCFLQKNVCSGEQTAGSPHVNHTFQEQLLVTAATIKLEVFHLTTALPQGPGAPKAGRQPELTSPLAPSRRLLEKASQGLCPPLQGH